MANSPVMNTLTAYVEQRRLPLISAATLGAKSAKMFNLQTGIKTSAALNLLATDVKFGDGLSCGWSETGTQSLTQRVLNTGNVKINMAYCDRTMLKYWTQFAVRQAAGEESLPFEEQFINEVIKNTQAAVEKAIWQGDTTSDDVNLKVTDGLLKIAKNDASVNKVTIQGTSAYDDIMAVYMAIPAKVLDGAVIFVGEDKYREFTKELMEKNLFHYDGAYSNGEIFVPGTNVKVVAVSGLNGTGKIFAARPEDIYFGTDMEGDEEKFDFWYSKDSQEFRLVIKFNFGVQYSFSDQVVLGATA